MKKIMPPVGGAILLLVLLQAAQVLVSLFNRRTEYFIAGGKKVNISVFNKEVEKMIADIGVPAVSLAVIENNEIVFFNSYGYKQNTRNNAVSNETVFEACSLSKSFLVFVAHQLVEEGILDLDKPMYRYMENKDLAYDARYKLITPRMILNHSSGLENWRWYNNSEKLEILYNPGEQYVYSGEGYNYLAEVIALLLHKPHEQYIRERVLQPLHLGNTYLRYEQKNDHELPENYAVGHNAFGNEYEKWKNRQPVPASGYHTIARDYANLVTAFFNGRYLSGKSLREISTPSVRIDKHDPTLFYGSGFKVIVTQNDTIISQSGNNTGFRADFYYSVVHKRGFVFFTNSDRGLLLTNKLNELTSGLPIAHLFRSNYYEQYPSNAIAMLKLYREKQAQAMFAAIENLKRSGKLGVYTLNELGREFTYHDRDIALKLLEENIKLYPGDPLSYALLGELNMNMDDYAHAKKNFEKAKALGFDRWPVDDDIKDSKARLADANRRKLLINSIGRNGLSTIQGEDYNAMRGVQVQATTDQGGGDNVGYIDNNDWMDYRIDVSKAGLYKVSLRVASMDGGSKLELRSDSTVLTSVDIGATRGWQNWTTLTCHIQLRAGSYSLKLYAVKGGFNVNWIQLQNTN